MRKDHLNWYEKVTRGDSIRRVADQAGISDATLGRQVRSGELKADIIMSIAEAYNESPVIALVDLGLMSAKWITEPGVITALSRATDEQLTDELLRRLHLLDKAPVDELAARRRTEHSGAPDVHHLQYVADDTDTEPGPGDDGYHDGP